MAGDRRESWPGVQGRKALPALAALLSCALVLPGSARAETFGSISGVVTEASSGTPLVGIRVCAISTNIELLTETEAEHAFGCTKSETGGAYAIGELQPEKYIVHFEAPFGSGLNLVPQFYEGKLLESEASTVSVAAGETTSKIGARLAPGARIAGKITDASTGAPLQNAIAIVARPIGEGNYEVVSGALANATGEYLALGIPSGEAVVAFIAPGYQLQFFMNKAKLAEATVLSLAAPELTAGINAALIAGPPPEAGESGSASGAPGSPAAGAPGLSKATTPEGVLSLLHRRIAVHATGHALLELGCGGHAACRAKVTLHARRWSRVKGHARLVSVEIGTSRVLSIAAADKQWVRISLNAAGRSLLHERGGLLNAVLTVVTPGHKRDERVVLRASA